MMISQLSCLNELAMHFKSIECDNDIGGNSANGIEFRKRTAANTNRNSATECIIMRFSSQRSMQNYIKQSFCPFILRLVIQPSIISFCAKILFTISL